MHFHIFFCLPAHIWLCNSSPHWYLLHSHCTLFLLFCTRHLKKPIKNKIKKYPRHSSSQHVKTSSHFLPGSLRSAALHAAASWHSSPPQTSDCAVCLLAHTVPDFSQCGRDTVSFGRPCLRDFLSPHQFCLRALCWLRALWEAEKKGEKKKRVCK